MRSAVVLPHPDGPSSTTSSPGASVQVEPVEGVHVAVGAAQPGHLDGDAVRRLARVSVGIRC